MTDRPQPDPSSSGDGGDQFVDFEILAGEDPSPGALAGSPPEVHQATGIVSVQLDSSIAEATAALTSRAVAEHRSLRAVAVDVIDRLIVFPIRDVPSVEEGRALRVEDWYAANRRQTERSIEDDPIDADRWLSVHRDEVVGASSDSAVALIRESGMVARITQDGDDGRASRRELDSGRISLRIDDDGNVRSAEWG